MSLDTVGSAVLVIFLKFKKKGPTNGRNPERGDKHVTGGYITGVVVGGEKDSLGSCRDALLWASSRVN